MIRGVMFDIAQGNTVVLWQILNCIDIEKYHWFSIQDQEEVWDAQEKSDFFDKSDYDGKCFAKYIQSKHYIIFIKLQAYLENGKMTNIHTYEDFIKDACQLILLVNDCEYVEIYCKDEDISRALYNHAMSNKFINIEYITDQNDHREQMNVL